MQLWMLHYFCSKLLLIPYLVLVSHATADFPVLWNNGAAGRRSATVTDQIGRNGHVKTEVLAFSVSKNWKLYDWSRLTTIGATYSDPELVTYAHSKGVKVVPLVNFPTANLTNASDRSKWVAEQVTHVKDNGYDGVNVDFEDMIDADRKDLQHGLTALMKELYQTFKTTFNSSQVTFDVAWSPKCIDKRCYDYAGIAEYSDFIVVMDYDTRSQIYGECIAWANSPFTLTTSGITDFLSLSIPAEKLVLGLPWYGYDYPCINYTQEHVCYIKPVPFRGVNCSDAAGSQVNFKGIIEQLLPQSFTGRRWDSTALSPYFSYKNKDTGMVYQVRYDDPLSLLLKYNYAKRAQLRGVAIWNVDAVDYGNSTMAQQQRKQMWTALPKP